MSESLLRLATVMDRTGIKRSKLYALIGEGKFPQPMKIDGCALWPESDVRSWIDRQISAHRAATQKQVQG